MIYTTMQDGGSSFMQFCQFLVTARMGGGGKHDDGQQKHAAKMMANFDKC